MSKRTDIHRPSVIVPTDYEFVGFWADWFNNEERLADSFERVRKHMETTGGSFSDHAHGGSCHVCGAHARYTVVFFHWPTRQYIRTGNDCAHKLDHVGAYDPDAFRVFHRIAKDVRDRQAGMEKAELLCQDHDIDPKIIRGSVWDLTDYDWSNLPRKAHFKIGNKDNIATDIVAKLVRYGDLSEKQWAFLSSLVRWFQYELPEIAEEAKAEEAERVPAPEGRVEVEGEVVSVKMKHTSFGDTLKMTVKASQGFMVWLTVPSAIDPRRGDIVRFTATLTASDDDPSFAFGKRPSKASIVKEAEPA